MKRELWELLWGEVAQLTFDINKTLRNFCNNVQEYDTSVPEIMRAVQFHEFPILVIFPKEGSTGKLILHMIKHLSFVELGAKHGLSMNGKSRGLLSRLVVDVECWHGFTCEELKPVYESMNSSVEKRAQTTNTERVVASATPEVIYDSKRLKILISNKSFQPTMIQHILDLYERVNKRDANNKSLQIEVEEMNESIRLLEEGICFAQRNLEACERRVSAQKGQRNKANNRFASTIEALNLEVVSSRATLRKDCGYAKMKLTKGLNRLEKEELLLSERKVVVSSSSLKLAVFEQLRVSIKKLNRFNSTESIRRILCVVLPLVIPTEGMRKTTATSKSSVAELLGFNERSILGKHVFEKSHALHTALQSNTNEIKIFEDAVLPVIRQKRFDTISTADRELAINWWSSNTEVSPNKKDVIRFRSKDKSSTVEHCIHRQYQTDEYIHSAFLKHSGCEKMSLTYFTDLKPWYVRKGTDDTCLCRNCEDFRLAKKAVSYHGETLDRPYRLLNVMRRFIFPFLGTLRLIRQMRLESGLVLLPGTAKIVFYLLRASITPLLSIGELCRNVSGSGIIKRLLCNNALPDKDHRGNPKCYGECAKTELCKDCYDVNGEFRRIFRNRVMENESGQDGWNTNDLVSYTSYSDKKGVDTSSMSLLYQHNVHPSLFVDYFNRIAVEYAKHLSKLIRQKNAQREQERNMVPHILIVDIDFSQNFIYTDRKSAIQSDHWTSTSVTIFVAVVRYLCGKSWSNPPIGLVKGQPVSIRVETDDGGGDVYVYGEVSENQTSTSSSIKVKLPNSHEIVDTPCESIRVRNIISVPLIVVSDSKKHDTHFVRYFLSSILLGPTGWLNTQEREIDLSKRIKRIDIDSDGAASHFKQRGSIHYITYLSALCGLTITWTFGCAGHGKGTWDGLGGIVKNKTGHYIKAVDSFISSAHEVYKIIDYLFAGEEAQARYDKMANLKIKVWNIIWLPDDVIIRPPAMKKTRGKKKAANLEGGEVENIAENEEADEGEKIGTLQAFHGVGTRGLFYFYAEHRDGLGVRLSGCHCPFCVRCYRKSIGSMPTGCLSNEPYEYIICNRLDDEWTQQTASSMSRLSEILMNQIQQGDIIAVGSNRQLKGSTTCIYNSFDIAKVLFVQDLTLSVNVLCRQPDSAVYLNKTPDKVISILHTSLRYIISNSISTEESCITLDSATLENIVRNCFNGAQVSSL